MNVLIVDGSKERRRGLTFALAELTNVVVQGAVPDVRSALSALATVSPDVVVTEATLPDGDGTYLIERIRARHRMPAVIVLAERGTDEQRKHYITVGADSYIDGCGYAGVCAAVLDIAATRHASSSIPSTTRHGRDPSCSRAPAALDAMKRLNATLLTYARGDVPMMASVDLGHIVSDTLAITRSVIPPMIDLVTDIGANLRPIIGVRPDLEQVVRYLVINACDAMATGGKLEVRVKQCTSQAVMLEVSDDGIGIEAGASKAGRHGVGLGLTIVRDVIARQGGALRIVSRPTGGMTAAVMLPTAAAASS